MASPQDRVKYLDSHEGTLRFIELFEAHSCLWDDQDPYYGKIFSRSNSLGQISYQLQVSRNDVEAKINKLKTKFKECIIKKKLQPGETIKWPYFEQMRFLEKTCSVVRVKSGGEEMDIKVAKRKRTDADEDDVMDLTSDSNGNRSSISLGMPSYTAPQESITQAAPQTINSTDEFFRAMANMVQHFPRKRIAELKVKFMQHISEVELALADQKEEI